MILVISVKASHRKKLFTLQETRSNRDSIMSVIQFISQLQFYIITTATYTFPSPHFSTFHYTLIWFPARRKENSEFERKLPSSSFGPYGLNGIGSLSLISQFDSPDN